MSKFTPGPWGIEKSSVITEELEICDISYCDKNGSGKWIFGELSQANARLIAAAPEMYAALGRESERPAKARDMMEREGFVIDNLDDRWQKLAFSLYTMLVEGASDSDAALAKAEGRE